MDVVVVVVVVDAGTLEELNRVASVAQRLPFSVALVGSSDLGRVLVAESTESTPSFHQLFAVIGSMSEIAQRQIEQIRHRQDVHIVDLDIRQMFKAERNQLIQVMSERILTLP